MKTITGDDIFFNFIEVDFNTEETVGLIEKLYKNELDGFVARGVFSLDEVQSILERTELIPNDEFLPTSNGRLFPNPYATISDKEKMLDEYIRKNEVFDDLPFGDLQARITAFFNKYSGSMGARPPHVLKTQKPSSFANFRFFMPNMGGLFVHCGYFFQEEHPTYFEVVEEMDKSGQLSFFLALQYPDRGGELTVYDLLWPETNGKDSFEQNDCVLNCKGERIFLKDVNTFTVRPEPGDILVFRGGPIWHRVENIHGSKPRVSFGGFINFSKDGKEFFYWG